MARDFFEEQLQELRDKDLHRAVRTLKPVEKNRALLDGKPVTLFCGNDYLGLARHPRVIELFCQSAEAYGVGSGAARLISGSTDLHERLECKVASLKMKPRALLFSAGYLANLGTLAGLAAEKDLIVMDKLCHASLIDGARLSGATLRVFPHKNYRKCAEILKRSKGFSKTFLVTDSVFSMDGDLADFEELVRLKKDYACFLIVDDAHGTGVLGRSGRGAYEDTGLAEEIDAVTGTLSKAIGCQGGFAAASESLIEMLVNRARPFIFATALPPAVCGAALEAARILEEDASFRDKLWENIRFLTASLREKGFISSSQPAAESPIIPLVLGEEKKALEFSRGLLEKGILIPAVRYPTVPKGKARLRLTVNALHEEADFRALTAALEDVRRVSQEAGQVTGNSL